FAWIAQRSAGGRGAEPLAHTLHPDQAIVIAPYIPSPGDSAAYPDTAWGAAIVTTGSKSPSTLEWAEAVGSQLQAKSTNGRWDPVGAALDRAGVPTIQVQPIVRYVGTPGEMAVMAYNDQVGGTAGESLGDWLLSWLEALPSPPRLVARPNVKPFVPVSAMRAVTSWPPTAQTSESHRTTWRILAPLVHAQGISEHEEAVRDTVLRLLPASLRSVVDPHGNVIVRWGKGKPRRAFMAHMDEIGYRVTGVDRDGRLRTEKKGGFYDWLYEGETVRRGDGQLAVVAPRADYLVRPRPTIDSPLSDRHRVAPSGFKGLPDSLVRIDPGNLFAD